jgi:hypothetical protein
MEFFLYQGYHPLQICTQRDQRIMPQNGMILEFVASVIKCLYRVGLPLKKQARLFHLIGIVLGLCNVGPQSYKVEFIRPYSICM